MLRSATSELAIGLITRIGGSILLVIAANMIGSEVAAGGSIQTAQPIETPSVFESGFGIVYLDRSIHVGEVAIKAPTEAGEFESGLFILLIGDDGRVTETVLTDDFGYLLQNHPGRAVVGISIHEPGGEYGDQFFFGRLNPDLTELTVKPLRADVFVGPEHLRLPMRKRDVAMHTPISFRIARIAHAGGGLGNRTYTNSYEALNWNYARGFRYFEIDFEFTSDGFLVCLHDWGENFERAFGFTPEERLTLSEFEDLAANHGHFRNCTLRGLAKWMASNPEAIIVSDVRGDNVAALKQIGNYLPEPNTRVIPQIYLPENFQIVKDMGFERIIWTLYRSSFSDLEVIDTVEDWQHPFAITMPKERAYSALAIVLRAKGVATYAHTVNSVEEFNRLTREFGVTEIYTDFLIP